MLSVVMQSVDFMDVREFVALSESANIPWPDWELLKQARR